MRLRLSFLGAGRILRYYAYYGRRSTARSVMLSWTHRGSFREMKVSTEEERGGEKVDFTYQRF